MIVEVITKHANTEYGDAKAVMFIPSKAEKYQYLKIVRDGGRTVFIPTKDIIRVVTSNGLATKTSAVIDENESSSNTTNQGGNLNGED